MSDRAVRPVSVNGLTTATNATVTASAAGIVVTGNTVMISVGIAAVYPIYIMFGREGLASTLTSTTGFRLPAGFVGRISVPMGASHLYHLRVSSDSDISVLGCDGGI
jgi:hypothetical protein